MALYKIRNRKSLLKRIKILRNGKIKHWKSNTSHLAHSKTNKRKRHLKKSAFLSSSDKSRLRNIINVKN